MPQRLLLQWDSRQLWRRRHLSSRASPPAQRNSTPRGCCPDDSEQHARPLADSAVTPVLQITVAETLFGWLYAIPATREQPKLLGAVLLNMLSIVTCRPPAREEPWHCYLRKLQLARRLF
mmetsp:Transcript_110158/g.351060  ORF Transcript_110158/g.351060 Transcript_110158/m.351060 type:complete len:120 (+) Transcript_110158:2102-2461(+)